MPSTPQYSRSDFRAPHGPLPLLAIIWTLVAVGCTASTKATENPGSGGASATGGAAGEARTGAGGSPGSGGSAGAPGAGGLMSGIDASAAEGRDASTGSGGATVRIDAGARDTKTTTPDAADAGVDTGSVDDPYVRVCGMSLCLKGKPFRVKGATAYGTYDNAAAEVSAALAANLNTLEIVEFETLFHTLSDTMSEATWTRVDKMVAAAGNAGLHIIFNLSSYGQSLEAAGQTATTVDWQPYLQFITSRVNTVNHVTYKNDPTIALIELFGEIPQPNGQGTNGTSQQMTDFYHRTLTELAALDPNHLRSTGGFSYLDEPNAAGIDWKTIMNDPADSICAVEVNSSPDRNTSVPMVSSYCKSIGKPWFLAAWSSCIGSSAQFTGDIDNYATDAQGAAHATDMYAVASNTGVSGAAPAIAAIGSDFWNLASGSAPTCNINPGFPQTYAVVKAAQ